VPTDHGVATVACSAPRGPKAADFRRDCESVAATLELAGSRAYPLGPSESYARTLGKVMTRLDGARSAGVGKLRGASTREAQAAAAKALEAAYLRASRALAGARVSPADAAANRSLSEALKQVALAYSRAATAAGAGDTQAYSAAGGALTAAQAKLRRGLSGLERLGYVLP
jgi:hypothetical protein